MKHFIEDKLGYVILKEADKKHGYTITKQDNKCLAYVIRCFNDRIQKLEMEYTTRKEKGESIAQDDMDELDYTKRLKDEFEYIRNAALKE
ncbi:hypothetical protein [Serratia sp. (in: enterobacteria)]|uniref:hypothetical protein n=1 Tax=Serratia sp. (in: enterobacteria) TaxID=616 RepID=UPI00398A3011